MKIFFTNSVKYLKHIEGFEQNLGEYEFTRFCDKELYVKVQNCVNEDVLVVTNTIAPSENILELMFLLDALTRLNCKINLFFTYFAYARQDRIVEQGECLSAQVISKMLNLFNLNKIYILHAHSERLLEFLNFEQILPLQFYEKIAQNYDVIISPDKGGISVAELIAKDCNKEFIALKKIRTEHDKIEILHEYKNVQNKNVLIIDDMITTGSTVIKSAELLLECGAKKIDVAATHAILCDNATSKLNESCISKIYVSNSIEQKILPPKFQVFSIASLLQFLI